MLLVPLRVPHYLLEKQRLKRQTSIQERVWEDSVPISTSRHNPRCGSQCGFSRTSPWNVCDARELARRRRSSSRERNDLSAPRQCDPGMRSTLERHFAGCVQLGLRERCLTECTHPDGTRGVPRFAAVIIDRWGLPFVFLLSYRQGRLVSPGF